MPDTNHQPKESFGALTVRIKEIEQQVLDRRQCVHARANTLVRHLKHEMTLPTTLLLAGGVGFIVGELTKQRSSKKERQAIKRDIEARLETTPLKETVNFVSLARHLTLPLGWIVDAFFQEGISKGSVAKKSI
jgi:hypothetical protein